MYFIKEIQRAREKPTYTDASTYIRNERTSNDNKSILTQVNECNKTQGLSIYI